MASVPPRVRAVISEPAAPGGLVLREVDRPCPTAHEVLVRVAAVSLDRDEFVRALVSQTGKPFGSDLVGTVEVAAADGSGVRVGARIVGLVHSGAWAEFVAIPSDALVELPAKVSLTEAAALPTAGLTALYGLGYGGLLTGKRVLIACGTGGVGLCSAQLAHLSGAQVTATIPDPEHDALMEEYGADHIVVGDISDARPFGPYHLVMAAVGSSAPKFAPRLLQPGGTCVLYGTADPHSTLVDEPALVERGARMQGLTLLDAIRREQLLDGLRRLLALVETRALQPHINFEAGWTEIGSVSRRILSRGMVGKAVLHF